MIRSHVLALRLLSCVIPTGPALAEVPAAAARPQATGDALPAPAAIVDNKGPVTPAGPVAQALRQKISALPGEGSDEELRERAALSAFYLARADAPLWVTSKGLTPKASALVEEIKNADAWGLEARDFSLPALPAASDRVPDLAPEAAADAELTLSLTVLKYARYARGGRIINPPDGLSSHLDRRPQLIDPKTVLDGIASADDAAAYLRATHPQHPQFERLRQKYLALRGGTKALGKTRAGLKASEGIDAKKLLANMEEWRWMPADMGDLYVLANVPEFMLHVVKNGEVVDSERIVAGEVGKQTSIFSRRMKEIVFRPKWRVPESIKVRELWPNLLRGGGLFRQYGLQLETKEGEPVDFRTLNWAKADIRDYEVVQPPGPKSVLGVVKFSFPSQHTIYMHDTPDKWMFNASQRTLSHGCMRVRNPLRLAQILLAEDKGWDAARVTELAKSGPLNNEVAIDRKIMVHVTYFTAWVGDDGTVRSYRDVYGHEQRIRQALDGKWSEIVKGPDHLAPPQPDLSAPARLAAPSKPQEKTFGDYLSEVIGGNF